MGAAGMPVEKQRPCVLPTLSFSQKFPSALCLMVPSSLVALMAAFSRAYECVEGHKLVDISRTEAQTSPSLSGPCRMPGAGFMDDGPSRAALEMGPGKTATAEVGDRSFLLCPDTCQLRNLVGKRGLRSGTLGICGSGERWILGRQMAVCF